MPDVLHVFTSAAVNYLPKVRILCRSMPAHHPEAVIHLALADERPQWLGTRRRAVRLDPRHRARSSIPNYAQLDASRTTSSSSRPRSSRSRSSACCSCRTAAPSCISIPDMVLFSRVDDILATLATANLALTPHQTKPEQTLEAILDNEVASLKHGIFNLGFIGVRNTAEGRRFADWWAERTLSALPGGRGERPLHRPEVDQFRAGVLRRRGDRQVVAPQRRDLEPDDAPHDGQLAMRDFEVDGEPLGFYHFTGFDSGAHRIMAIKNAAASPPGAGADRLVRAGDRRRRRRSRQRVAVGVRALLRRHADRGRASRLYREHHDLQAAFPDPYDAGPERELSRLVQDRGTGALSRALRAKADSTLAPKLPDPRWRFAVALRCGSRC